MTNLWHADKLTPVATVWCTAVKAKCSLGGELHPGFVQTVQERRIALKTFDVSEGSVPLSLLVM